MMQQRCLHEVKGSIEELKNEDLSQTVDNMMSLNTMETGYSILNLEEALQTFKDGEESKLFCLKLKISKLG